MKYILITITLAVIFALCFLIKVDTLGPVSVTETDDLGIAEMYFDPRNDTVIFTSGQGTGQLSLEKITETNRAFEYDVEPRDGNSIHWNTLKTESPSLDPSLEKVAVLTGQFASFNYYHFPPDGRARKDNEHLATIPEGYKMALYRGPAEFLTDNRTSRKSYVLVTDSLQADGRCGYQFFFDPSQGFSLSFENLSLNGIYLPSFLALCIALPLAFSGLDNRTTTALFILAFVLHGVSIFAAFFTARFAQAFGSYDRDGPLNNLMLATGILIFLVVLKYSRTALFKSGESKP